MKRRLLITAALLCLSTSLVEARPVRWCGWWLRQHVSHDPGKDFNNACYWKNFGKRAMYPSIGTVVVWCGKHHRHVGKIAGPCDANGNCLIISGNDGHAVRTRERSIAGAELRDSL